jgi:hypothetical protein
MSTPDPLPRRACVRLDLEPSAGNTPVEHRLRSLLKELARRGWRVVRASELPARPKSPAPGNG